MKKVIWKLTAGNQDGQETADDKLAEGMKYIERLKNDGEKIMSVENDGKKLTILIEE